MENISFQDPELACLAECGCGINLMVNDYWLILDAGYRDGRHFSARFKIVADIKTKTVTSVKLRSLFARNPPVTADIAALEAVAKIRMERAMRKEEAYVHLDGAFSVYNSERAA